MRRVQIIGALCLATVACLMGAVGASAAPTDPFQYKYSFTAPGITEGFEWRGGDAIAVNHATGNVFVLVRGALHQFDRDGDPLAFPAVGSPTISVSGSGLAIDNTGGPTQGNIYVLGEEYFRAFAADGATLADVRLTENTLNGLIRAERVIPDGTLRILYVDFTTGEYLYAPYNSAGERIGPSVPFASSLTWGANIYDELGNFYLGGGTPTFHKYGPNNEDLGETGLPEIGPYLAVDPATNDLYARTLLFKGQQIDPDLKILGIHYSNPLVESTPFEIVKGVQGFGPFAFDSTGETLYVGEGSRIGIFHREPPSPPTTIGSVSVSQIRSEAALLQGELLSNGAAASYHFEYGTDASYGSSTPTNTSPLTFYPVAVTAQLSGLKPDTTYHVRIVLQNSFGTRKGPDMVFKTYAGPVGGTDPCPNALARKQTGATRLPDCRAYELVSAPDTGGYDVESYLAPGQTPFPGFPRADDRVLYATHAGAVPGPWRPTNKGPDPYMATRTDKGWVTDYEGLPSNLSPAAGSFSSILGEADSSLSTLAFAGAGLCEPCFGSGLETGIPVRMPDGQLFQGMAGSLSGSVDPSAKPEGKVAKYFSGDGKKLLFASKYAFEPGANDQNGSLTVYERDLNAATTEIVSTDPAGNVLTGEGISGLDVSDDGSRVVIGKKVSVDPQGNEYVNPYLHIAGRPGSVDLAPLATDGVLYAGMTSDGSRIFFTSPDKLTGADSDESADLYEAEVDGSGNLAVRPITPDGGPSCSPVGNEAGEHWNASGAKADCSAVAISGGGGVASSNGAIYFLSPEQFGGQGTLNQPNLYLARPSGQISLLATLEPNNPLVLDSVKAGAARRTSDFQTTPSGNFAAFVSDLPLSGLHTFGFRQAFLYDAGSGQLACPSCDFTGTSDGSLAGNAELAPNGLSLLADGRLFFTTSFPLLLNDANGKKDVYEWTEGRPQLISTGSSPFDAGLLTASADGTDVFFFTNDALAPEEDRNGALLRIYDAREGGGFFKLPTGFPCAASDECHGPSSVAGPTPPIRSSGKTTPGNVLTCPKNRVKKRGQCVKKAHQKKKHAKKRHAKKRHAKTTGKRGARHA